jgi:hypothetical protein
LGENKNVAIGFKRKRKKRKKKKEKDTGIVRQEVRERVHPSDCHCHRLLISR